MVAHRVFALGTRGSLMLALTAANRPVLTHAVQIVPQITPTTGRESTATPTSSVFLLNFKSLLYSSLFPVFRLPAAGEQMEQNSKQIFFHQTVGLLTQLSSVSCLCSFFPVHLYLLFTLSKKLEPSPLLSPNFRCALSSASCHSL